MKHLLFALAVLAVPVTASAEPSTAAVQPFSMDRLTPESAFRVDVGYEVWDTPPGVNDITVLSFDVGGHFVARNGAGAYLSLPLSFLSIDTILGDESELMVGNLEVGGLYAMRLKHDIALVLHGGVALPTASDSEDALIPGVFQAYASVPRYGDLVQRIVDSTWLRLGGSAMGRMGPLFWRGDLGLDIALDDDNLDAISPVFRLNVGGGVDLGAVQLLGELVTNVYDSDDDDSASTFTLGARFSAGNFHPGVALVLPLGQERADLDYLDMAILVSLATTVGY